MLLIVLFFNLLVYANSEYLEVKIDGAMLSKYASKTDMYDYLATHEFYENQLSEVNCSASNYGIMNYVVKDEPRLAGNVITNNITMLMKMRTEPDGNYIDCVHNMSGSVTVVRIMLKPIKYSDRKDFWRTTVNDVTLEKSGTYRYVKGETLQVSCQQRVPREDLGFFNSLATWAAFETTVDCPKMYSKISLSMQSINTRGVSGLVSSNIKFLYVDFKDRLIIQYEYEDNENLTLSWNVTIENRKANKYEVFWKNSYLKTTVWGIDKNSMLVNISTFSPTTLDDRKIVQLKKTVIHGNTKRSQETWIVLCRKKSESEAVVTNNRILLFRILVAGGVLTLLILILVAVWLVIRMKYNKPKEECSDNYYGNLSNEDSSGPFPRQWDTYANTMVESDQGTSVQDLYTKPVPKSLRQGKLGLNKPNDTYTNVPIHPAEEELYSDVGGYANPVRK